MVIQTDHDKEKETEPSLSSQARGPSEACLFIANLPQQFSNEQLSQHLVQLFEPFGHILSVKSSRDKRGRPYGFIQFETVDEAYQASLHGSTLLFEGRRLRIEKARCMRSLLLRNVHLSFSDKILRTLLEQFSAFDDISGRVVCIGYAHRSDAVKAFKELRSSYAAWLVNWIPNEAAGDPHQLSSWMLFHQGSKHAAYAQPPYAVSAAVPPWLYPWSPAYDAAEPWPTQQHSGHDPVSPALPHTQPEADQPAHDQLPPPTKHGQSALSPASPENTVFVGRLNAMQISDELLLTHFGPYGAIKCHRLVNRVHDGPATLAPVDAFAFVTYEEPMSAVKAVNAENGSIWLGQSITCVMAYSKPPSVSPLASPWCSSLQPYSYWPSALYPPLYPLPPWMMPWTEHGRKETAAGEEHSKPDTELMPSPSPAINIKNH
jgi:RNA recognition motif-containing protein